MTIKLKRKKFLKELSNLIFFWVFGVVFFTLFRLLFITFFRQKIQHKISLGELLDVLLMGFRFDCTAVAYFLLLPF